MKEHDFYDAWCQLERIDIQLSCLRGNGEWFNDIFNLKFIEEMIVEYEKLFPYEWFSSRESIVKKKSCSICNSPITLRKRCCHEIGKLYMGEMCKEKIDDFEIIGVALVKNPFDKYAVLIPEGLEYNYFMLESLMPKLNSPYDKWSCHITVKVNPIYHKLGRNHNCVCGSGNKFKYCCLNTDKMYFKHHEALLHDNPNAESIPFTIGSTWKSS